MEEHPEITIVDETIKDMKSQDGGMPKDVATAAMQDESTLRCIKDTSQLTISAPNESLESTARLPSDVHIIDLDSPKKESCVTMPPETIIAAIEKEFRGCMQRMRRKRRRSSFRRLGRVPVPRPSIPWNGEGPQVERVKVKRKRRKRINFFYVDDEGESPKAKESVEVGVGGGRAAKRKALEKIKQQEVDKNVEEASDDDNKVPIQPRTLPKPELEIYSLTPDVRICPLKQELWTHSTVRPCKPVVKSRAGQPFKPMAVSRPCLEVSPFWYEPECCIQELDYSLLFDPIDGKPDVQDWNVVEKPEVELIFCSSKPETKQSIVGNLSEQKVRTVSIFQNSASSFHKRHLMEPKNVYLDCNQVKNGSGEKHLPIYILPA